jgi:hypothetical protein
MTVWNLILLAVVFSFAVCAIFLDARLKRGRHRSLARTFKGDDVTAPARKPVLGMEATDVAAFNKAIAENSGMAKITGRNGSKWHSHTAAHSQPPVPLPDDATYAARFHNAFGATKKDFEDDRP